MVIIGLLLLVAPLARCESGAYTLLSAVIMGKNDERGVDKAIDTIWIGQYQLVAQDGHGGLELEKGMNAAEFVVVQDAFMNETCRFADLISPV